MRSLSYDALELDTIRERLKELCSLRFRKRYAEADRIRLELLSIDSGIRIVLDKNGRASLWHWPDPPFTDWFHCVNYGEFIASSEEEA